MTIEALRKSLKSPYGIQSLNTHDVVAAIEEFDYLKAILGKFIEDFEGCYAEGEVAMIVAKLADDGELQKALNKIKADAIREATNYAVKKAHAERYFTLVEEDLFDYANQIEGE